MPGIITNDKELRAIQQARANLENDAREFLAVVKGVTGKRGNVKGEGIIFDVSSPAEAEKFSDMLAAARNKAGISPNSLGIMISNDKSEVFILGKEFLALKPKEYQNFINKVEQPNLKPVEITAELKRMTGMNWEVGSRNRLEATFSSSLSPQQQKKVVGNIQTVLESQFIIANEPVVKENKLIINDQVGEQIVESFHKLERADKADREAGKQDKHRAESFAKELKSALVREGNSPQSSNNKTNWDRAIAQLENGPSKPTDSALQNLPKNVPPQKGRV